MTLFRQIALLVSAIFLLLLLNVVASDLTRSSELQQGQLKTTAQDMATTLSIAISNLPGGDNQATLEVLFNAVFDSGYYSSIELVGIDGETMLRKSQEIDIEGVPDWFVNLVPLVPASGSSDVMKGWSRLGSLELELHPGFAYSAMYQSLTSALRGFALLFVVSMLVLWLFLRSLLRPLQRVREQADAIHRNQFIQQQKIPLTQELKAVVKAMNLMVSKVHGIFDDQQKTLERYQQLLYRDELSKLGNRRYLLEQLSQSMTEESGLHGSMAIIKIVDYENLREDHGYEICDNLVRILADLLRQSHAGQEAQRRARFSDDEFAFLSEGDETAAADYLRAFFDSFRELVRGEPKLSDVKLLAGICALEAGGEIGSVLSDIDYCLSQAGSSGPFSIVRRAAGTPDLPNGKMQWRSWFESVLAEKRLFLAGQLAVDGEGAAVQREVFVRARDSSGTVITAGAFMPMASSLGMSLQIDKEVFRQVTANRELDRSIPLAINLGAAFFELAEAQQDFEKLLDDNQRNGSSLCIEASHHLLNRYPSMCEKISERARLHGHRFGIDNLDLGLPLQLLQSGHVDYVKINAGTLRDIGGDDVSAAYQALRTITDTLEIRIIAVAVDSQHVRDELKTLDIDIMQGNFLAPPETI